jgi:glycosyltransferase involved in cell wall biosynthesis
MKNKNIPLISICVFTYNHEKYIKKTLEGIFMQKVSFPYEVIIHDDASDDKTQLIIENFKEENEIKNLRLIFQDENQLSQGIRIGLETYKKAKGKFIAVCEGDDYWIDEFKLQKQINLLKRNPNCSLCCHAYRKYFQESETFGKKYPKHNVPTMTNIHFFLNNQNFIAFPTVVFKKEIIENPPEFYYKIKYEDLSIKVLSSLKGNIGYIDDIMAIYRIHQKGMSQINKLEFLKNSFYYKELISNFLKTKNIKNKCLIRFRVKILGLILIIGNWKTFSKFFKTLLSRTMGFKGKFFAFYYSIPWVISKFLKYILRNFSHKLNVKKWTSF